MKKYGIFLWVGLTFAGLSCRHRTERIPVCKTIDVRSCRDSTMLLSMLSDTVVYTKLAPTDSDPIAPSWEPRLISLKKYLVILYPDVVNSICHLYDKNDGRFLGRIGTEKQVVSPEKEVISSPWMHYALATDESGDYLFGRLTVKEKNRTTSYCQKWDLRSLRQCGDTVRVPPVYPVFPSYFGGGRYAFVHFNYSEGEKERPKVTVADRNGKVICTVSERRTFRPEPTADQATYLTDVIGYRKGNTFRYHNAQAADTIFAITDDLKEYPVYRLDCGDKTYPYYYEARVRWKDFHPENYYAVCLPRESANYLFFQYRYQGWEYYGLYDIRNERLAVSREDPKEKRFRHAVGGLSNDLDGGLPFWPDFITDEDEMGRIQQVKDIRRMQALVTDEAFKTRPAYRNLAAFIRNLPDETYVLATVRIVR